MPLHLLSPYVYFFSWIVLAIFSYVYDSNFIYEPLLLYLTSVSIYYTFEAFRKYKLPVYFKTLVVFVGVLCIYGLFLVLVGDSVYWRSAGRPVRKYLYILWLASSLLSVFPVYVFTCRGWLNERKMKILFFVLFVCCVYAFYGGLEQQKAYAALMHTGQEEFTITSVYAFLSILPLVVMFKDKPIVEFFLMIIMFVYFVLGSKRGVVILGGGVVVLIIISMIVQQGSLGKKCLITIITAVFFIVGYTFLQHQMENSLYFSSRVEQTFEGYTSNRDVLAKNAIDFFENKTSLSQFFFGLGAQGSLIVNENFTHNDWLSILLEQGLWGILLYVFYWVGFAFTWIKSRHNYEAFIAIGLLMLIGFGKTLFSMYYLPVSVEMMRSSGFFTIALGYYLGKAFPQYTLVLSDDLPK